MKNKHLKWFAYTSGVLLIVMATFHGSGLFFITEKINASNLSDSIKSIFPVLFVLPSIELIGLGALCFLAPMLNGGRTHLVYYIVFCLVLLNATLAFYLKAWIPGIVLFFTSLLIFATGLQLRAQKGIMTNQN